MEIDLDPSTTANLGLRFSLVVVLRKIFRATVAPTGSMFVQPSEPRKSKSFLPFRFASGGRDGEDVTADRQMSK
jgi:hypothetical protein